MAMLRIPPNTRLSDSDPKPRGSRGTVRVRVLAGLGLLIAAVIAFPWLRPLLSPGPRSADPDEAEVAGGSDAAPARGAPAVVTLPPEKLSAAEMTTTRITRQSWQREHSVPGRVAYNDDCHVAVTSPTDGILTEVLVKPGDRVEAGDVLGWLNSSEIGTARADVLLRQAEAELASSLAERAGMIAQNVLALTQRLRTDPEFEALEREFAGRLLGDYRSQLFAACSRARLAESLLTGTQGLAESGAVSGVVMRERQAAARTARGELHAACEQAELDVRRENSEAEAAKRDARRRLRIAEQHLASLLLSSAAIQTEGDMPDPSDLGASDNDLERLSRVAVRAPFAGTIEERTFSASERVQAKERLFVLADTTTLWINAEIRENDWPAMTVEPGQTLSVAVPALGDSRREARVAYIGREVSPATNAIPIVAVIDNADGQLRPGLFVRVTVPVRMQPDVLTVPSESVLRHEQQTFVFVAEAENRFRRVDVEVGEESNGRVEILNGLREESHVVTRGTFVLKSELLLEGEE